MLLKPESSASKRHRARQERQARDGSQMVEEVTTKDTKVHEASTLFLREPSCS
jgi:hypothetical protein